MLAEEELEENWLAVLDAHGVEFLLLDVDQDGGLLREVEGHPGWAIDVWDGESVLLHRKRRLR
ncbi:MAG: hypothetical protein ACP5JJ_04780 [Anaerolineae bacterium]